MANLCCYDLYATGKKEDLEKFEKMMKWEGEQPYINSSMYCDGMYTEEPVDNGDGTYTQHFSSATRWSVHHGMIDREDIAECVNLATAAKKLYLSMEIWSNESGCCFAEHIIINDEGGYDVECEDYYEINLEDLIDNLEKDSDEITKDDLEEYLKGVMDEDNLENLDVEAVLMKLKETGFVSIGGFEGYSDFPFA